MSKLFRKACVLKSSGFSFRTLTPYCEKLDFLQTGGRGEHVDTTKQALYRLFEDFNPTLDVVVPVGSALVNFLAGQVLTSKGNVPYYNVAIYLDMKYQFWQVSLLPEEESEQL